MLQFTNYCKKFPIGWEVTKEELLKKPYYDLKNPDAYTGKYKRAQEARNHLRMTKEVV